MVHVSGKAIPGDVWIGMYRTMLSIRFFEDQVRNLHLGGLAPGGFVRPNWLERVGSFL